MWQWASTRTRRRSVQGVWTKRDGNAGLEHSPMTAKATVLCSTGHGLRAKLASSASKVPIITARA
jgi:hypothetical protein